jgi:hypothetical protein
VTSESLQACVRQFIDHGQRVALSIVPRGRGDLGLPDSTTAAVS